MNANSNPYQPPKAGSDERRQKWLGRLCVLGLAVGVLLLVAGVPLIVLPGPALPFLALALVIGLPSLWGIRRPTTP